MFKHPQKSFISAVEFSWIDLKMNHLLCLPIPIGLFDSLATKVGIGFKGISNPITMIILYVMVKGDGK